MRWIVTLEGNTRDIARLLAESPRLSAGGSDREAVLEFDDGREEATDESRQAIRAQIEAAVRHFNGFGRLRWGRSFEGVTVKGGVKYFGLGGESGEVVFVGSAHAHLTPEQFGDLVERLGHPRPEPPFGLSDIEALDAAQVIDLADSDPIVARVLRLVDLMLVGDENIDWSAAYSALETIEADAGEEHTTWYTRGERRRFTGTANSIEAVGVRARHGREFDAPHNPMSFTEASWFIRGVTARWLAWRRGRGASASA